MPLSCWFFCNPKTKYFFRKYLTMTQNHSAFIQTLQGYMMIACLSLITILFFSIFNVTHFRQQVCFSNEGICDQTRLTSYYIMQCHKYSPVPGTEITHLRFSWSLLNVKMFLVHSDGVQPHWSSSYLVGDYSCDTTSLLRIGTWCNYCCCSGQ